MSIKVLHPGLLTSIQDIGRYGYQKHGVIVSGAMDAYSLRIANLLVGNEETTAALEITLLGPRLVIEQDILIAITGGDLSPTVDDTPIPMWRPVYLKQGSVLKFGACKSGCRAYLAVGGGYQLPAVMNSKSTYLRAGIGGFNGRAIKKDDCLTVAPLSERSARLMAKLAKNTNQSFSAPSWYFGSHHVTQHPAIPVIRVTRGIQYDCFSNETKREVFHQIYQVTPQSDRMGYRLSGKPLMLAQPLEMISEAVALGTVQVPPDGNPIILLADRQTVGGYPKIAQVALVDIPKVAQIKPGGQMQFCEISGYEAEELYLARENLIDHVKTAIDLKLIEN